MIQPPIADAPTFALPPRCAHINADRMQCAERGTTWMVSPDGKAIIVYCAPHAEAGIAEYEDAAAGLRAEGLDDDGIAGWTTAPVVMAVNP